jgi:LMBR1-like membrane protein
MDHHYARCVDKLLTLRKATAVLTPELQRRRTTGQRRQESHSAAVTDEGYPTIELLARLNRTLQLAQNEVLSAEQRWLSVVKRSEFYAELSEGTIRRPVQSNPDSDQKVAICLCSISSHIRYIWLTRLRNPSFRVLGMMCAVLSGVVLWSEATLWLPINASPFAWLLRWFNETRGILFQLSALIPFLYMSACVYSSLFKLSLFGPYKLRGFKMSSGVALVFNAQYLVRMQFPLGYNYLFI